MTYGSHVERNKTLARKFGSANEQKKGLGRCLQFSRQKFM